MEKETLQSLYYKPGGAFKSQKGLYNAAKKHNLGHTQKEVNEFIKSQIQHELFKQPVSNNSFIPKYINQQWQMDIEDTGKGLFLVCVDAFSKKMSHVPLASKSAESLKKSFQDTIKFFEDQKPATVYADQEKGWLSSEFKKYLEDQNISIITAYGGHAPMAERSIRTVKERLERARDQGGHGNTKEIIAEIVKDYNENNINELTKMTPNQILQNQNEVTYENKRAKPYPILNIGDNVRIVLKLQPGDKKATRRYSENTYEIQDVIYKEGFGHVYKVNNKEYLRKDLLLANATEEVPKITNNNNNQEKEAPTHQPRALLNAPPILKSKRAHKPVQKLDL